MPWQRCSQGSETNAVIETDLRGVNIFQEFFRMFGLYRGWGRGSRCGHYPNSQGELYGGRFLSPRGVFGGGGRGRLWGGEEGSGGGTGWGGAGLWRGVAEVVIWMLTASVVVKSKQIKSLSTIQLSSSR